MFSIKYINQKRGDMIQVVTHNRYLARLGKNNLSIIIEINWSEVLTI